MIVLKPTLTQYIRWGSVWHFSIEQYGQTPIDFVGSICVLLAVC